MAFKTYQAEKYIEFILTYDQQEKEIYRFIQSSPFTKTQLGNFIGVDYYGMHHRLKNRSLTRQEIIKLLNAIK